VAVNGFRVETRNVAFDDSIILLVFKVTTNNFTGNGVCDIAVYADTDVGGSNSHYISPISNVRDVYWSGFSSEFFYVLNVIGVTIH
jgi:hypothetical protein